MKKFLIKIFFLLIITIGFGLNHVNAQTYGRVNTDTFILDKGHDLGKIIPKGYYFIPQIEYKDAENVKNRLLEGIKYRSEFYQPRHIDAELINGDNPYMEIVWSRPYFVTSLSRIKRILKGYLFAYRTPNGILWMDAKDFTPAFLTGYKTKEKQSIIIYPIKHKITKKVLGFMQYPCGNLVCKDSNCSELDIKPTCGDGVFNPEIGEECDYKDKNTKSGCNKECKYDALSCEVYSTKENIYTTSKPSVRIKKGSHVTIDSVYLNKTKYKDTKEINKTPLTEGKYILNAIAINDYSGKKFLCKSNSFNVVTKEYCGDGIVNRNEECDYNDSSTEGNCSKTCKFLSDSCVVKTSKTYYDTPFTFNENISISTKNGSKVTNVKINDKDVTNNYTRYYFDTDGSYEIKADVYNPITGKSTSCHKTIKYKLDTYCGDGIVNGYEQCDDGNKENGDGCSSTCKYEKASCSISKYKTSVYAGTSYRDIFNLKYTGNFEGLKSDDGLSYSTDNSFYSANITGSQCKVKRSISYIVSNPINPSVTKECTSYVYVEPKLSCGDGIITKSLGEECDYNDSFSGYFCSNTCQLKENTNCELLKDNFTVNKKGLVVVKTDDYAIPYKLELDGKKYTARSGIFSVTPKHSGDFTGVVYVKNKIGGTKNLTTCEINLTVKDDLCSK